MEQRTSADFQYYKGLTAAMLHAMAMKHVPRVQLIVEDVQITEILVEAVVGEVAEAELGVVGAAAQEGM
jgi:hypothetical protein